MTSSNDVPPSFSFYDLLNACTQTGCPVYRIGAHSVKCYLESLFYEYINNPGARDNLLKSLGFCKEHAQLLLITRIADGMGASIIYANVIRKILREFPNDSSLQKPSSIPHPPGERARMISRFVSASDGPGHAWLVNKERCPLIALCMN